MTTRPFTYDQAFALVTYFDVADETWDAVCGKKVTRYGMPVMTLADLDKRWVQLARLAAEDTGLPWPPDLAAAEEYFLDHGPAIDFAIKQGRKP